MKILFFGDIHYPREARLLTMLINLIKANDFDILGICGDILNYGNSENLRKFLAIIHKNFSGKIVAVMGNHDFWLSKTSRKMRISSWDLVDVYKRIFRSFGDHLLWNQPAIFGDIAFVGVPGWYDYSFAPWHLGISRRDLDIGYYKGFQWNDFIYTNFGEKVEDILEKNLEMLDKQYKRVLSTGIKQVIVLLHFVPIRDFIKIQNNDDDFWNAYLGGEKLGELIFRYRSITKYVFFGHVDTRFITQKIIEKNGIKFINVDITPGVENSYILEI